MPNCIDWVLAFFGAQLAGAVTVAVNARLTDEEVAYIVKDSGASTVIEAGAELPDGKPYAIEDLGPDDLAAIFYTSGTTGAPKGAMLSHANFLTSSENCMRVLGAEHSHRADMSSLVGVPLFHVVACNSQLIPIVQAGGRVEILSSPLDFDGICRAVAENAIRHIVSVPAVFHVLVRHPRFRELDASGITWVSYGGSPIAAELVKEISDAFPNAHGGNGFGLTECSGMATFLPHEESLSHPDSVGYAVPVVDLALKNVDQASGVGELLIRGANVAQGYWCAPEATAETFMDGWLHSGDLARIDADGRAYVVDRKKDMISRGAENVYSLEVENALTAAPGVAEAAVIPVPDEMMGEKVGAVLVPTPGIELDLGAVIEYCGERLAEFKLPQYVVVSDEPLPRNANGKVLKAALRADTRWGRPLR
jgi:acyl-CoA synthetase (AMP-forming)/AMP-acid ligase II